jgi:hypothetical protein
MNNFEFGQQMKVRTKAFAVQISRFYKTLPKTEAARVLGRQLLRSGTSVAALNSQTPIPNSRHALSYRC